MASMVIVLAVFTCWTIVGYALTSTLLARRQAISNLLMAPVVGMGALELAAHACLRCGSAVGPLSHSIVLGALLLAIATLVIRRPPVPFRRILPFYLILLLALTLSGWPLFRWGGDWVANSNEDMANYCLGGTGFREHGFRTLEIDKYFSGEDATYGIWSLYCDRIGGRRGSEVTLAMTSAIAGQPVPFIFMPVILAMHMVLISSVGFLLYRLTEGRKVSLIACLLMAFSPLMTYGIVQQLLGQVGGMGILVAGTGLFLRPANHLPLGGFLKRGALCGIVAASLLLHYTEGVPFLVAVFGLHVLIGLARRRFDWKQLGVALFAAGLLFPLLGNYLFANLGFLYFQTTSAQARAPVMADIFPQYLNAEGFARLWGFETVFDPVRVSPNSSWPLHRLVLAGVFFFLLSLAAGIALVWRRRAVAGMLLTMAAVAAFLLRARSAFGLFKLAMYAQPFILGSVVLGWARMNPGRWKWAALICIISLVPLQFSTQSRYMMYSYRLPWAGGVIPGATDEHLLSQYHAALQTTDARRLVVPVNDQVSIKLLGCLSRDVPLWIPSNVLEISVNNLDVDESSGRQTRKDAGRPNCKVGFETLYLFIDSSEASHRSAIALHDPVQPNAVTELKNEAPPWVDRPNPGDWLLEPPERFSVFNRFHRSADQATCRTVPLAELNNFVFWRQSSKSKAFNVFETSACGLYSLWQDPHFPKDTMVVSGRYLSLQVLNPSTKIRMMVAGTATYCPDEMELPQASFVGDRRVPLPFTGQGAARVISEPISVQTVGLSKYVLLDLGPPRTKVAETRVARDPRQISLYLRDVSLLSEEQFAALVPPTCVNSFPAGLALKNLEFSGCGEDGTVGKQSWFRLSRPQTSARLIVRGRLPTEDASLIAKNKLVLKWNGVEVGQLAMNSSAFELSTLLPEGIGPGKLELEFSEAYPIPQSIATRCAQLTFVGFEP